jgi:integrase
MPAKSNRKGLGEGTVRKRKDGRWEARYTVGYSPKTGKQIQRSIYGQTRNDAAAKLTEVKYAINSGTYIEPAKIKAGDWINNWLENYAKIKLKASTFENYSSLARIHIVPIIAEIALSKLKTRDLQRFYNEMTSRGKIVKSGVDVPLSVSTIKHIHYIIHGALDQAVKENLIRNNPDDACVLPSDKAHKINILPMDILPSLLDEARKGRHYTMLYLDLSTGLRRGELLGLRWDDIDFDARTITLERQLVRTQRQLIFTTLKTEHSNRCIQIPESAAEVLLEHKAVQEEERKRADIYWVENNLIFCNELGGPLDPSGVYHYFKRLTKRLGLDDIRFHDIRHTFATIALQNGVDIKTIQETLGHYNPAFTLHVYGHVTRQMQVSGAKKVDDFLRSKIIEDDKKTP